MFVKCLYLINQSTMSMTGIYDRNGKQCSLVKECKQSFIVDYSPVELLEYSIECTGYNLRGALETAKKITGLTHLRPIIINPVVGIVLFPTKSMEKGETLWINPNHIVRTSPANRKTYVLLSNGEYITVDGTVPSFSSKSTKAEQLLRIILEKAHNPQAYSLVAEKDEQSPRSFSMMLDPSKRKKSSNPQDDE